MDTEHACTLLRAQPLLRGVQCFAVPCWHADTHRPLLHCIFATAHAHARTPLIAYVNGDIVLHTHVARKITSLTARFHTFAMVARRTDTLITQPLIDASLTLTQYEDVAPHVHMLLTHAQQHGVLHSEYGIDLFVYAHATVFPRDFPPFLAGVYR